MSDISTHVARLLSNDHEFRGMVKAAGIASWSGPAVNYPSLASEMQEPAASLQVRNLVTDLLQRGEPIPTDIARPVLEARAADDRVRARADAIRMVLVEHEPEQISITDETIEPALVYLDSELEQLLDRARDLAPALKGATTATEIVEASPSSVDAWRELRGLAQRYAEIRRAHLDLFKRAWANEETSEPFTQRNFDQVGEYADFVDIHKTWTDLRRVAVANSDTGEYRDWLGEHLSPKLTYIDELEAPSRLALIAANTQPWLPNVATYLGARNAAQQSIVAVDQYNLKRAQAARVALLNLTGRETTNLPEGDARITPRPVKKIRRGSMFDPPAQLDVARAH